MLVDKNHLLRSAACREFSPPQRLLAFLPPLATRWLFSWFLWQRTGCPTPAVRICTAGSYGFVDNLSISSRNPYEPYPRAAGRGRSRPSAKPDGSMSECWLVPSKRVQTKRIISVA